MNSQKTLRQYEYKPNISLLEQHESRTQLRLAWNHFIGSVPLPALWITAHLDFVNYRSSCLSVYNLRRNLARSMSSDTKAHEYRVFLQKFITPINRKILKSRSVNHTFHFRGCLERNADDPNGSQLHFHFFLWEPRGLFQRDPSQMQLTADLFDSLWHQKVNDLHSDRYTPIDIQPVFTRQDAINVSGYMLKSDKLNQSYELFDDWSSSTQMECLNKTSVVHQPTEIDPKTLHYPPHQGSLSETRTIGDNNNEQERLSIEHRSTF